MRNTRCISRLFLLGTTALTAAMASASQPTDAHAQTPGGGRGARGPAAARTTPKDDAKGADTDADPSTGAASAEASSKTAPAQIPEELLEARPGGITADQVANRAARTSYQAKAGREKIRAAAATLDSTWGQFLPQLTVTGRYTRLSTLTPPIFGDPSQSAVYTTAPPGTLNPASTVAVSSAFQFPIVLDNYLIQASVVVPLSDYYFTIAKTHSARSHAHEAAKHTEVASRAKSATDGQLSYYTWLRARGAVVVALQALNDQRAHLRDARNQLQVGNASKSDVLRSETAVSAAELAVLRARNLAEIAEVQVRTAIHAPDSEALAPGELLETDPAPVTGDVSALKREAIATRPELKSLAASAEALRKQASAARGQAMPSLSAFGDLIYANPNQRKFPLTQEWFPTWQAGAQITWTPNSVITGLATGGALAAQAAELEADRSRVADGVQIEVVQAYQKVREADAAIASGKQQVTSATEALRVTRELFLNGRATSTTLTEAETQLTRARLEVLNAQADARVARVQLNHALGRDAKAGATTP